MPTTHPNRRACRAIAAFLCGLGSVITLLLANFFASRAGSGLNGSAAVWLLVVTSPVAVVGIRLSRAEPLCPSHRRLAMAGMVCSTIFLVYFSLVLLVLYVGWSNCFASASGSCR
jgi:hypothetical protein